MQLHCVRAWLYLWSNVPKHAPRVFLLCTCVSGPPVLSSRLRAGFHVVALFGSGFLYQGLLFCSYWISGLECTVKFESLISPRYWTLRRKSNEQNERSTLFLVSLHNSGKVDMGCIEPHSCCYTLLKCKKIYFKMIPFSIIFTTKCLRTPFGRLGPHLVQNPLFSNLHSNFESERYQSSEGPNEYVWKVTSLEKPPEILEPIFQLSGRSPI